LFQAREFRYDGARARYMNRPLNPSTFAPFVPDTTVWTDYDGDEAYRDYLVGSGTPPTITNATGYEPGLARIVAESPEYLHNDHLGTLRLTTNDIGVAGVSRVFTAFGEPITQTADRFGYVGASSYQANPIPESPNPDTAFPYLHVGARYYDPSSGRFLQRDPIGIMGGTNGYADYTDLVGSGIWGEKVEDWVARKFWMRAPIVSGRLATMGNAEAYGWAIGGSVVGGVVIGTPVGRVAARVIPKRLNPWIGTIARHGPEHGMGNHLELIVRWTNGKNLKLIFPGKNFWPWMGCN